MLEDREWIELLSFLLERLDDIGAGEIATEIRSAISARVVEVDRSTARFGVPLALYKDVGSTITRAPTPREAFLRAIEVLQVRLETLPAIVERTAELLQRAPSEIVWLDDDGRYLLTSERQRILGGELTLSDDNKQLVKLALDTLSKLLIIEQTERKEP